MQRRILVYFPIALSILLLLNSSCTSGEKTEMKAFRHDEVKLLSGPFLEAQQTSLEYVLELDVDRLLAPYLKDAGITPLADNYGNWENTGLDGHIGGHYLTSLSLMYAATGKDELKDRLDYMVDWLGRCQEKNGDGYVGSIPNGQDMWADIARGNINAGSFSLNHRWVPLYNIHKEFAGLRDAYLIAGNKQALEILVDLTDWLIETTSGLSDEQIQDMLRSEHGGLNEVFADVYKITGDEKYLDLAKRFSHRSLLDPLVKKENTLTGMHANTQIPKVIGYKRVAEEANNSSWDSAAVFFWEEVTDLWTISIGGNSVREHFHPADDFSSMIESEQGPETCNTYNMLKLTQLLFLSNPEARYMDYYERAMFNHILSSQHNHKGGYVYFTPMRPEHYRVYSSPQECFWCCVGSGLENHAKYGEMIYTRSGNDLFVNMFIASELQWNERGLSLKQETKFPDEESSTLSLELEEEVKFSIYIRKPYWLSENSLEISVNGKVVNPKEKFDSYVQINRKWQSGDKIQITFTAVTYAEKLPDESNWVSFLHGPIVLSAISDSNDLVGLWADGSRMGHVASGPKRPLDSIPAIVLKEDSELVNLLTAAGTSKVNFTLHGLENSNRDSINLLPFYKIHEARYITYFPFYTEEEYRQRMEELALQEKKRKELEALTIDQINPGEQQPESDHFIKFHRSRNGVHMDRHWRDAHGWFSYQLKNPGKQECILRITYFGRDAGRNFKILLNGETLASVSLKGDQGNQFFDVDYEVDPEIIQKAGNKPLTLRFEAEEGSVAGGIYGIRLMSKD